MSGPLKTIRIDKLVPAERNPNEMDEAKLDALSELIARYGFLQPILASPIEDGLFRIVDGHHRVLAAKRAGHEAVLTLARKSFSDDEIEALRIGMNVLRGDLNYKVAAEIATELRDEWGWDNEKLGVAFGFSDVELDELFEISEAASSEVEDDLGSSVDGLSEHAPSDEANEEKAPNPFVLKIEYDSRSAYMKARRALRKYGGKNATLNECMAALLAAKET